MHHKNTEIELKFGDITKTQVDAIVNPANSYGLMGGGVAFSIKKEAGAGIEKEAISEAPIRIGEAIATSAGKLEAKYVIHAPTMEEPAQPTNLESIEKATLAALKRASKLNISSVAFPGMGTGVGGVSKKEASSIMIETIKNFLDHDTKIKKIVLVAYSDKMYDAFRKAMGKVFE